MVTVRRERTSALLRAELAVAYPSDHNALASNALSAFKQAFPSTRPSHARSDTGVDDRRTCGRQTARQAVRRRPFQPQPTCPPADPRTRPVL